MPTRILLIVFLGTSILACGVSAILHAGTTDQPGRSSPDSSAAELSACIRETVENSLQDWLTSWQALDSTITLSRFRLHSASPWAFSPSKTFNPELKGFQWEMRMLVCSPDSSLGIFPWGYWGGPDVRVELFDLRTRRWDVILLFGTPHSFDDAAWYDNTTVIVAAGYENIRPGRPFVREKGEWTPELIVFDLAASTRTTYRGPGVSIARFPSFNLRAYRDQKIIDLNFSLPESLRLPSTMLPGSGSPTRRLQSR